MRAKRKVTVAQPATNTLVAIPRPATKEEHEEFLGRLSELLDRTRWRLARLADPRYELRMRPVRQHTVRAHVRNASERPYLMKRATPR